MELIQGILINYSKYRDNDCIFNVLTENSFISIIGIGAEKQTNKTNKFKKPFLYGEFDTYKGPTNGLKLRDCKVFNNYSQSFVTLEDSAILDFLSELTFKCLIQTNEVEGYFDLLNSVLKEYNTNSSTKYSLIIYYFAQIIKLNGIELNLNECIECSSKTNIVGIDYINGGLVCSEHNTQTTENISKDILDLWIKFFSSDISEIQIIQTDWNLFKSFISKLHLSLENNLNLSLKSIDFILSI